MGLFSKLMRRLGYVSMKEHGLVIGRDGMAVPAHRDLPAYSFMVPTPPAADSSSEASPPRYASGTQLPGLPNADDSPMPKLPPPPHFGALKAEARLAAGTGTACGQDRRLSESGEWERRLEQAKEAAEVGADYDDETVVAPSPTYKFQP